MSRDNVTFRVGADTDAAVQAYYKFIQAQRESERAARDQAKETREAAKASREHDQAMSGMVDTAKQIVGALGVATGVAGAVGMIERGVANWQEHMDAVARSTREALDAMISFSQVQEKGTLAARTRAVAAAGTAYGFSPSESLSSFQAVQSQLGGNYEQAMAAFAQIGALRQAGVPAEAARDAILVGTGLGYTAGESARAAYAAGKLSSRTPADIAGQAGVGLPTYAGIGGGMPMGYAVMAQLSSVVDAGRLGSYTERVGRALTEQTFWRRFRVREPGADPLGQLETLAAAGITTAPALRRRGMNAEQSQALSILLQDVPGLRTRVTEMRAMMAQEDLMAGELAEAERQLPQLRTNREIARTEQMIGYERTLGPRAVPATERELTRARRALLLQRRSGAIEGAETRADAWPLGFRQWATNAAPEVIAAESDWTRTGTIEVPPKAGPEYFQMMRRGVLGSAIPPEEQGPLLEKLDQLIRSLDRAATATERSSTVSAPRNAPGNE